MKEINKNTSEKKGHFIGMVPLLIFLVLYMLTGLTSGSFENMPLMVGILIASGIALMMNNKDNPTTFEERVTIFCKGGGDHTLMLMVIIFILAGAFYGVANGMKAVDSMTNLGLSILPSNLILPGLSETAPTGQWPSWQLLPMELSPCLSCTSLCQSKSITSSTIAMPNCCLWAMSLPHRLTLPRCPD